MFEKLKKKGFEIVTLHHAEAILTHDMPAAVEENSFHGVAKRNGHGDDQLRLLETPRGYRGQQKSP